MDKPDSSFHAMHDLTNLINTTIKVRDQDSHR